MTDNYKNSKELLQKALDIKEYYDKIAELTGSNFNIFDIIGIKNDEVRLHSALLKNLLDVKGSHGMGSVFLEKFIGVITDFSKETEKFSFILDVENSHSIENHYIGDITQVYEEGGYIDLLIHDTKSALIIENKIYAKDQEKQLVRYSNYGEKKFDNKFILLYLTLDGSKPSENSAGNKKFYCISYREHIIKWLELCLKEASQKPLVRETIQQYINLIKILTNQTISKEMAEDIKKILKNKDFFLLIDELKSNYDAINKELNDAFLNQLNDRFKEKWLGQIKDEEILLYLSISEDNEGFYYGCHAYKLDKETIFDNEEKLKKLAQKIAKGDNKKYQTFGNWLVWKYAERKRGWKFTHLSTEEKANLLDKVKMDKFVSDFEEEVKTFVETIKKEYIM